LPFPQEVVQQGPGSQFIAQSGRKKTADKQPEPTP
jgi:hypothetical protein